ncbi:MAG: hypothetical protein HY876_10810 [Coriobacteriales bacterium]|nr:hypothetical protein [Coriobacteriales bacterium]
MRLRPRRLNSAIAALFAVGSACFALGTLPAYLDAVGAFGDAVTFFVGSLFFTSASFSQLVQAQSPELNDPQAPADDLAPAHAVPFAWLPRDRNWLAAATQFPGTLAFNVSTLFVTVTSLSVQQIDRLIWAPDFVGSVLFLVSSVVAILALGRFLTWRPTSIPWRIAWLNMLGSIAFMISAIGSFVLPRTGDPIDPRWMNLGTFLGALCFFGGAILLPHAWARARG